MKQGSLCLVVLAIAVNPWRFLTQAALVIQVFSVFAGKLPMLSCRLTRSCNPKGIIDC
jgi:hypothetical protein